MEGAVFVKFIPNDIPLKATKLQQSPTQTGPAITKIWGSDSFSLPNPILRSGGWVTVLTWRGKEWSSNIKEKGRFLKSGRHPLLGRSGGGEWVSGPGVLLTQSPQMRPTKWAPIHQEIPGIAAAVLEFPAL